MLMGITRIGNLIINENGFNLLLIVVENGMTGQRAARESARGEGGHAWGRGPGDWTGGEGESVKRCVIFKTTFHKI